MRHLQRDRGIIAARRIAKCPLPISDCQWQLEMGNCHPAAGFSDGERPGYTARSGFFGTRCLMILKSFKTVDRVGVTMAGAKDVEMQLLAGPGDGCQNFAMRRFIVAAGGCTPK